MNKKTIIMFLFVISLILLYGCQTANTENTKQSDVKQVKVIASCDDNNSCTDDAFNQLTQQCEHKRKDHCCGDSTCDSDERCDTATYKTICPEDCPRECPAKLLFETWNCEGSCIKENESFKIYGDGKITAVLKNIGELGVDRLSTDFTCIDENGNYVVSTKGSSENIGVSFNTYFTNFKEGIYLSGTPYGKDSTTFYLEMAGIPKESKLLTCDFSAVALGRLASEKIKIQLSPNQ